ncbi:MAG TPA: outer membrane protein assembly factor BamB [Burkholderiales bacterium]|nr:outer membrane protein assembly factor BamB [Burkholderiales bacterium]
MTFGRSVVCFAAVLLAACSSNSRIEQELPATLTEFKQQAQVRELWSTDVGSLSGKYDARLVPVFDANTIYVANATGRVMALASDSGRVRWNTDINAPVTGATAIGEGLVVVGSRKGEVFALDASDGKPRWTGRVSSEVQAPPAIGRGIVVVQTVDGKVTGLSAADGKRLWIFDRSEPALSLHGTSQPSIVSDVVLAGFANGKIVALQLKDGKLLWEQTVAQPHGRNEVERLVDVDAPTLLWGDILYAVAYQGKAIALDMRTGRGAWSRDVSSYVSVDADRTAVLVSDERGHVLAFDARAGASLWRQDKLHGRGLSGPVLHGDLIAVGDFEGYLHWLARDDGHFVARFRLDKSPVRARAIVDGATMYVASQDGRLAALQLTRAQ